MGLRGLLPCLFGNCYAIKKTRATATDRRTNSSNTKTTVGVGFSICRGSSSKLASKEDLQLTVFYTTSHFSHTTFEHDHLDGYQKQMLTK